MKNRSRFLLFVSIFLGLALAGGLPIASAAAPKGGGWIVVFQVAQEDALRKAGVEVWSRSDDILVGGAAEASLSALAESGLVPIVRVQDTGQWMFLFHHEESVATPGAADASVRVLTPTIDLFLFPAGSAVSLPYVKHRGAFMGVPRLPVAPLAPHAADLVPRAEQAPLVVNPLVTAIVNATSQANWYQYVREMSGDTPVVVGGASRTINTRYSDAMFPTPQPNAWATEYLLEKGTNWGYTGVRETYTSTDSGCGGVQSIPWQNVIFTLPGQVDFGQHQQVLFVNHYDTISFSTPESFAFAPGADDAISGGMALMEALRLFKDYAFRNTVKIVFFSGEEVGLCGSLAYVHQHPAADMWRAINMDQTAYDGNQNLLMDCYNWSVASSPQSVALGDAFVQANSDYGPIVAPAKIVRDTSHMCQTDHCPFWNVGVAAIALTEDLHNNDICPCFDQFQNSTCHDTVTQDDPNHPGRLMFTQNYSWPTEKSAVALVAALADPLYACPASAPTPAGAPGNHMVSLSWSAAAGVTNYVVERAASCAGPFTAIASATGTSYDDGGLTNGQAYGYRLRTCPTQVSDCISVTPNGASVVYQAGSAAVVADSGDHDLRPDNCELVTVQVNLTNDGSQDLTGVKLSSISSSHPGVQLANTVPQDLGSLAMGESKPARFKFYLGENGSSATCDQAIPFTLTSVSDQSTPNARNFSLTAEKDGLSGTLSYTFDTDLSGWTVSTGIFSRAVGGAPGSTAFSLHSRSANGVCDAILSPVLTPSASSTMTMWVNFSIEGNAGAPSRWDRAVVRAINTTNGSKTLLTPSGVPYNTTGQTTGLCDSIGALQGWSGDHLSWGQASFNLASFAGIPIQIEVRFSTDSSTLGTQGTAQGFWFDLVQVTNASQNTCDAQSNVCVALPAEVSPTGSPVPFTLGKSGASDALTFSESSGASAYHVYAGTLASLEAGQYDHAAAGAFCGFTDGSPGDGMVTGLATLPENSYLLAVGANGSGESPYGSSSIAVIPMSLDTCP